jgi:hypothetical protein
MRAGYNVPVPVLVLKSDVWYYFGAENLTIINRFEVTAFNTL